MEKTCVFAHPMIQRTVWPGNEKFFLYCYVRSRQHTRTEIENGVCDCFHTVILQNVRLITGTKNMCALIDAQLISLNSGAFDELVCEFYATATGYLGRACRNQISEQHHRTLLKVFLHGKLHEAIRFVCEQKSGGGGYHNK